MDSKIDLPEFAAFDLLKSSDGKKILKNFLSNGNGETNVVPLSVESATTAVDVGKGVKIGGNDVVLMAGPCSVESYEQTQETMALLKILALGARQVEEGKVQPAGDVIQRLRDRNKSR